MTSNYSALSRAYALSSGDSLLAKKLDDAWRRVEEVRADEDKACLRVFDQASESVCSVTRRWMLVEKPRCKIYQQSVSNWRGVMWEAGPERKARYTQQVTLEGERAAPDPAGSHFQASVNTICNRFPYT